MTSLKKTPKGPTPSLISGQNGHPERLVAGRAFTCHRCDRPFAKGDRYIGIPQRKGAHTSFLRVCDGCFQPILAKTASDLDALHGI